MGGRTQRKRRETVKVVLGVAHRTQKNGGKTDDLRRLYTELKKLKASGTSRIGIESRDPSLNLPERRQPVFRYFYGACLLAQRLGIETIEIDDSHARRLYKGAIEYPEWFIEKVRPYFNQSLPFHSPAAAKQLAIDLSNALAYMRTLLMIKNANQAGLKEIVVGSGHAAHVLENRKLTVINLHPE